MDRYNSWNNIASSFYAADRIIRLLRSPINQTRGSSVFESNYSTIIEVLKIIGEYSPGTSKQVLNNFIEKSDLYSNTYRNLKKHVSTNSRGNMNLDNVTQALEIIKPVLKNNHKVNVEKVLKIYEIIKS